MKKVVFFDRDGTLIYDKIYLNDPDQIEYLPNVFEGVKRLRDHGFEFVIVTNQSGVPRGLVEVENLKKIHQIIRSDFAKHGVDILNFYYAPFLVESNHHWRKPNPGMLEAGIRDYNINPEKSWMVGDRMTDVEAGRRAGVQNVFLYGTEDPAESPFERTTFEAKNFSEVCDLIIENSKD